MDHLDRERQIGRAFVLLAGTLVSGYDVIELLNRLVAHCVSLLAADAAGVLLADVDGHLRAVATSSEEARITELLAVQSDEGPCVECYRTGVQIRVPDIAKASRRWPEFAPAVVRAGAFAAVHAIPLRLRGDTIGALNLMHRAPGRLPDDDLALGQALADVATIGILSERSLRRIEIGNEQAQTVLHRRTVIEQAKGICAQRFGVSPEEAFDYLRRHARSHNVRLAELARDIIDGRPTPAATSITPDPRQPAD